MDFMFWSVKGYTGINLTKEKLHNKKYSFDEIKESNSNVIEQIEDHLEHGGVVLALAKKKKIKLIYFFKLTTINKEKTLIFDNKIVLDEAKKCIKEFENDIDIVLNGIIFNRDDIDKVIWREQTKTKEEKLKSNIISAKILTWISIIIFSILSFALVIVGTSCSFLSISDYSIDEIKNNESIVNYVSDINNYSYSETLWAISEIDNKIEFAVFEIIIPTIFTLLGYILLIISLCEILVLIKNVNDNKTLFTQDKNQLFKKILLKMYIALLFILSNFILWIVIGIILEIIEYMFNYCVKLTNKQK